MNLRRVFDPLDTLFAIELVASTYCSRVFMQGFASAEATRGLSDRPLDCFGALLHSRFLLFL